MKSLVITDYDLPEDLFQSSVILNLNNTQMDDLNVVSSWMKDSTLLIFIMNIVYGMPDTPFLKLFEHMMKDQEPYYSRIDDKAVHLNLSQNKKKFLFLGYGGSKEEQALFHDYLQAFRLSYNYSSLDVYLCDNDEIQDVLNTFGGVDND